MAHVEKSKKGKINLFSESMVYSKELGLALRKVIKQLQWCRQIYRSFLCLTTPALQPVGDSYFKYFCGVSKGTGQEEIVAFLFLDFHC